MDEVIADTETETIAVPPPLPEGGVDEAAGSDFNVGLAVLMGVVVVLVCIQNVWLRRRNERENASRNGGGAT